MKNAITGVFILLILSIPFIAYNALVVIPKEKLEAAAAQAQLKIEEERRANEERIQNIKQCEANAWETYSLYWDNACKTCDLSQVGDGKILDKLQERFVENVF